MNRSSQQVTRRQCLALLAGASAAALAPRLCRADNDGNLLCLAISADTLVGVNADDARTAYLALINQYNALQGGKVSCKVVPGVFIPSAEILQAVRQGTVQSFGVTTLEYLKLIDLVDSEALVLQDYLADGIEYVLLVHKDSSFKKIADLRGAQILSHRHRDLVLMPVWLDTLLVGINLPRSERFFGGISPRDNVNQVALPVFFRRADAACLARRSWETAVELNPQLGRDLRPLVVSPRLIPITIGFRRNCNPIGRKLLLDSMITVANTTQGRQMAALYQANGFVQRPASVMTGTLAMVREFERLSSQQAGPRNKRP
jgi:ABC-type phosphate/phosphonate transport system substrate-binding protein